MSVDYKNEIIDLIIEASKVTGKPLNQNDFYIEYQPINHRPKQLPKNKMAVYTFVHKSEFLKIGQVNSKSNARYTYHHYEPSRSPSNLAKSILNDPSKIKDINEDNIEAWIKTNCERFDVIIDAKLGKKTLNFIEGLLHYKYNPKYEGKS